MIVEVVTCDIREHAPSKGQAANAVLHNAVTAHLHEGILASFLHHTSQKRIQRDGIRSRMFCGYRLTIDVVAHRREQSHLMSHVTEHLVQHSGNGRLTVRTRHTHQFHLARRVTIEGCCHLSHHLFRVLHTNISDVLSRLLWNHLAKYGSRSFLQCFANIVMTIGHSTPHSDEEMSFCHLTGVYLHATNVTLQIALDLKDIELAYEILQFHHY